MLWIMLLMPIVLLTLGVPIFIILAATSTVVLFFNDIPGAIVHQNMFGGISIFSLLAVPFFIFAGELMGKGGMSKRLVAWALSILGGLRGSLPLTTVGTSTVFGAISGSSAATVAAVGRLKVVCPRIHNAAMASANEPHLLKHGSCLCGR